MNDSLATNETETGANPAPEVVAVQRDGDTLPVLKPLLWWQAVLIRATRAGLITASGLLGFNSVGIVHLPDRDRWYIILSATASSFCGSLLLNTIELLTRLDQTNPKLRA